MAASLPHLIMARKHLLDFFGRELMESEVRDVIVIPPEALSVAICIYK
jgi:hypothetical protein